MKDVLFHFTSIGALSLEKQVVSVPAVRVWVGERADDALSSGAARHSGGFRRPVPEVAVARPDLGGVVTHGV